MDAGSAERFRKDLLGLIPGLRDYARRLTARRDIADDLLQDTILLALAARSKFQNDTNIRAWVFTIMRNRHLSNLRKDRQRPCSLDGAMEEVSGNVEGQIASIELKELRRALQEIAAPAREALLLVAGGYTYEEAAKICGCQLGTIKSRINRARLALDEMLCQGKANEAIANQQRPSEPRGTGQPSKRLK
jgi:RNA polymerase sigma factor (sigma-70 family)